MLCALCDLPRRVKPRISQTLFQQGSVSVLCFETSKQRQFMASDFYGLPDQSLRWCWPDRCLKFRKSAIVPRRARTAREESAPIAPSCSTSRSGQKPAVLSGAESKHTESGYF